MTAHPIRPARGAAAGDAATAAVPFEDRRPAVIGARALQRALPEGLLLLDYLLHDDALALIAASRERLEGFPALLSTRTLVPLVHSILFLLRSAAQAPPGRRREDPALARDLARLASMALWPALERYPTRAWPRALALLPVEPLARLPWSALPLPDGRLLCEATELRVIPGLRLGLTRPRGAEEPLDPPLVVASDAGELGNVEPETRLVREAFPDSRILAGAEATAERFLALAPRARWIHFAGHGCYQPEAPHQSGLRFADRWLPASELAGIRLAARWVTLSACQTARALVRPGEEWFGLARSLMLCGARCVVASRWDIEDAAALRLMAEFYDRLGRGTSLGAALAGAQTARLRAGAHPLEWAGFVILGGPELSERGENSLRLAGRDFDDRRGTRT